MKDFNKDMTLVQKPYLASIGHLLDLMDYLMIEKSVNLEIEKIAENNKRTFLKR